LNDVYQRSPNISTSLVLDSTKIYPKQNQKIRSTHERGSEPYPDIEDKNNDEETNERITGWLHGSHLTDNKLLSSSINNVMVYTGKNKDWSITNYKQMRPDNHWWKGVPHTNHQQYYNNDKSIGTDKTLKIPMTKNGEEYSINSLASEQKKRSWLQ
jgi:hypothetical protein